MYLLSTPTTIEWVLGATPNILLFSDLNLVIIDPTGTSTFITSPIATEDFIAPTASVDGEASYIITPELEGFWRIRLVTGTADNYKILSKVEMQVFDNTSVVNPYSPEIGRPAPYDFTFFAQGYVVASEIVGQVTINRDIVLSENDTRNRAYADIAATAVIQIFLIKRNDTQIGTITFNITDKVGIILIDYTLLSPNDKLKIVAAPGIIDYAIKDVSITLVGCCDVSSCVLL